MRTGTVKVLLVSGAIGLFVLLFFVPRNTVAKVEKPEQPVLATASLDVYVSTAIKNLPEDLKASYNKITNNDSLMSFWSSKRRPDLAAYFAEKKARESKLAKDWFDAGNRFYYSVQFTQDQTEVPVLLQCASRSFSKGLELEPGNSDAKIMLASTYVEGGSDPMKGISLLREVEKVDSNNVKLQLSFAFFSVRSGQLDKAIARFKKVLVIDPSYLEAYLHMADAYEQQGNKEGTIEMLEQYALKTDDVTARLEVEKYIKQLKETN